MSSKLVDRRRSKMPALARKVAIAAAIRAPLTEYDEAQVWPWVKQLTLSVPVTVDPSLVKVRSRVTVHMVLFMVPMQLLACVAQLVTC